MGVLISVAMEITFKGHKREFGVRAIEGLLFNAIFKSYSDGIYHLYQWGSNLQIHLSLKSTFCKQKVGNLIRHRVLRRLVWFCTQFADVP